SRLAYGMAHQSLLPAWLGQVHPRTRTPHWAILTLFAIVTPLAFVGTIAELASATVLLLLTIFAIMNGALIILKRREGEPNGRFEIPIAVPALGVLVCLGLVVVRVATGEWHAPAIAGGLLAAILAIYFLVRPKGAVAEPG